MYVDNLVYEKLINIECSMLGKSQKVILTLDKIAGYEPA